MPCRDAECRVAPVDRDGEPGAAGDATVGGVPGSAGPHDPGQHGAAHGAARSGRAFRRALRLPDPARNWTTCTGPSPNCGANCVRCGVRNASSAAAGAGRAASAKPAPPVDAAATDAAQGEELRDGREGNPHDDQPGERHRRDGQLGTKMLTGGRLLTQVRDADVAIATTPKDLVWQPGQGHPVSLSAR